VLSLAGDGTDIPLKVGPLHLCPMVHLACIILFSSSLLALSWPLWLYIFRTLGREKVTSGAPPKAGIYESWN
jgi:hypothetical protein